MRLSSLRGQLWCFEKDQSKRFRETAVKQRQLNANLCLLDDVLFLLKAFPNKLQGDDITIVDS